MEVRKFLVCIKRFLGISLFLQQAALVLIWSSEELHSILVINLLGFIVSDKICVGGFPNELAVAEGLQTYNYAAYAYLVVIVLVAIGGMVFQFKRKRKQEQLEKDMNTSDDSISRERLLNE